jgi:hypothetical protein
MTIASKTVAALFAAALFSPIATSAGTIVGLVDGNSLVMIDPANRKVTGKVHIKGGFNKILGIDRRPADGMLYGITSNGTIVTIDVKSGETTNKAKLSKAWKSGITTTVDFNPVADRLRVMGSDGANVRVNVDDGKVTLDGSHKYKAGDANAGKTPKVIAGSYTNAIKGAQTTTLYNVDAATGALVTQAPPNNGTLNTVGPLGVKLSRRAAFKIAADQERNDAWLVMDGHLYSVDLKTGKATMGGKIAGLTGRLTDIAWWE